MKILNNDMYLLLIDVDEEAEIKAEEWYLDVVSGEVVQCYDDAEAEALNRQLRKDFPKVTAYYPLTKEAKELDLHLLPNPFEDNIEKLSYIESLKDFPLCRESFEAGYKAAQPKQFSLEDMYRVSIRVANRVSRPKYGEIININEIVDTYIQSLSTQQLPKEFIPEYKKVHKKNSDGEDIGFPVHDSDELKTITNSEGKQELVGTYKYSNTEQSPS